MLDRHRDDEFIWALIFSLIINLLFVAALLTPYYDEKSSKPHPFFISLAMQQQPLPAKSPALSLPGTPAPFKRNHPVKPATTAPRLTQSVTTPSPAKEDQVEATNPLQSETEMPDPSPAAIGGESGTTAMNKEITDGLSFFGDKAAGGHYTAPEYLWGEKPPYPKRAERNAWAGTVLLSLSINASGIVEAVAIAQSSGYELLDQQARQSVSTWHFKPARRNGVAIATTVQQPIIFRPTLSERDP